MELIMTKCLSCGHIHGNLELNCPECGSFYSTIIDNLPENDEMNSPPKKITQEVEPPKNNLKQSGASLIQRFLKLFR